MEPGSFFFKFSGMQFKDYVGDKFLKVICKVNEPKVLEICEPSNLKKILEDLQIASLVPQVTNKGEVDKRCSIGHSQLGTCGSLPAVVSLPLSHSKLNEECSGSQDKPGCLNLTQKYTKHLVDDYYKDQYELLHQKCHFGEEKRYMLSYNNIQAKSEEYAQAIQAKTEEFAQVMQAKSEEFANAIQDEPVEFAKTLQAKSEEFAQAIQAKSEEFAETIQAKSEEFAKAIQAKPEEFAQAIDQLSISVMKNYAFVQKNLPFPLFTRYPDIKKEIELCYRVLVNRLRLHSDSKNDFMTNNGWKTWQGHALINGSYAVYYLSLQLYYKKTHETYLSL